MQLTMLSHSSPQRRCASSASILLVVMRKIDEPSSRRRGVIVSEARALLPGKSVWIRLISVSAPVRDLKAPSWATKLFGVVVPIS